MKKHVILVLALLLTMVFWHEHTDNEYGACSHRQFTNQGSKKGDVGHGDLP